MKKGSQGELVTDIQIKLKKVFNVNISIDGIFGKKTEELVKRFQQQYSLSIDGIVGTQTLRKLDQIYKSKTKPPSNSLLHFGKERFVVFVDAGHGGIDPNGNYTTPGKRAHHPTEKLHEGSNYYEGYENRLIAEAFIDECTKEGIGCVRTYHPYKDTPLSERTETVRSWLERGYYGYLHSFHSNAIALSNTATKLHNTRGFMVFNTKGDTFSDEIATQHFNHVKEIIGQSNWQFRTQAQIDKDPDYEANFQILKETDLSYYIRFGAILEEWGFHTSKKDAAFIIDPKNRKKRVYAALQTAKWVKQELKLAV